MFLLVENRLLFLSEFEIIIMIEVLIVGFMIGEVDISESVMVVFFLYEVRVMGGGGGEGSLLV